ncbi:hypothetical protein CAPTEDRAFT_121712 [Capitella teleta]|uniref:Amino acid permease/ SLC12A domain-containing protein n=1 Tax=Capitella teleta TaxID=283909 RepID=R7VCI4_CAPTE|nr:hypothetical protein CAPTEDRAFT_121712 [Capitella teleta]|eukprot:ELU13395.1 hypothetical protein CAPTEDRAFT_121712 [Capitella teleta]
MDNLKDASVSEKTPLLNHRSLSFQSQVSSTVLDGDDDVQVDPPERSALEKHITLVHATGIIIGTVCGTGIFISPTGVTRSVESVGMSLVLWAAGGIFSLVLALCYAEIGSVMPVSGGDYAYIQRILGQIPAFVCLWATLLLLSSACALMARSAALYLLQMFNMQCHMFPLFNLTYQLRLLYLTVAFAYLNCRTSKWSAKILNIFSLGKIVAMIIIIISGVVSLVQNGYVQTDSAFANTNWSVSSMCVGFVASFITFAGWDSVTAIAGEMKNPKRDLPIALMSSLIIVTAIYIFINAAYFSVLTVDEFLSSDAVAVTFAVNALPKVPWLVPLMVCIAAAGSINATYLIAPR